MIRSHSATSGGWFTPSDWLLRYSSKTFEDGVNGVIATCKAFIELDENKEKELRQDILKAVIEVKNDP